MDGDDDVPQRLRELAGGLLLLTVMLGTTAGSCGDDLARLARSGSDEGLKTGISLGDEAARAAPNLGATVQSRIRSLSEDEDVQEAAYGLAWDIMCDVVSNDLPRSLDEVVSYVLARAANFGLQFADEGAQLMGEAIVDELDGQDSEIQGVCGSLQP